MSGLHVETCGCGARIEVDNVMYGRVRGFREAHARCREPAPPVAEPKDEKGEGNESS